MDSLREYGSGFLGTGASMAADLTLLAYVLILAPLMIIGYLFARGQKFDPHHKLVMTTVTLANWVLILLVMAVSYSQAVAPAVPDGLSEQSVWLPVLHLITGGIAQVLATYLLIRMWFEKQLPSALKIKNIKLPMRITLSLWLITIMLGVALYFTWYSPSTASADAPPPVATEEAPGDADESGLIVPVSTEEADSDEPVSTEEADSDEDEPVSTEEADSDADEPVSTEEAGA